MSEKDDGIEEYLYCEKLAEDYFNSPEEHEFITLEEFAKQEDIDLTGF